ncbi:MAG: type I methionyl aminopeptidase [Clostridia bacterium]|nr:type I methionyl aminopeptidase [Clostridia bacterium]MDY2714692.1 type I methionyl aminopeptidase [Christensenellaceae bacterium]MDY3725034.1 type I methionyl aminopeptidase [Christensenellaceae bacterium]
MIYVKSDKEIELMRKPCAIVRDVLNLVQDKIRAGMTTKELDRIAHEYITSCGATPSFLGYGGFPAATCISIDEVVVHGFPSDRIIEEGQIVSVDVGAYCNGFHGDAARSLYVGNISPEKKKLIEVTRECFFEGIKNIHVGSALGDIGAQVQAHAEANGFSVVRDMVGHGVGKRLHEDPSVPNYGKRGTGVRLKRNMTIAIEPMINMGGYEVDIDGWKCVTADGLPSAHYENTVLIGDEGVEILTL